MENEAVLKQIADLSTFVREKADQQEQARRAGETREAELRSTLDTFKQQLETITETQKQMQPKVPADAPVSKDDEELFERGMFNGRFLAPYNRMLGISPNHPWIVGTSEAERNARLQDLNDAVAIRFAMYRAKDDTILAVNRLSKHPDTHMWARELQRRGYIPDWKAFVNPDSGLLLKVAQNDPDELQTRANELLYPGNTTQGFDNLTFTLVSSQLLDQVNVNLVVANNVRRIPMARSSVKWPKKTGLTQGVWGGKDSTGAANINIPANTYIEGLQGTAEGKALLPHSSYVQKPTIGYIQLDVEHILSYLVFNDDMLEDSIIPWLPFIREELGENIARAFDDACLNGDDETDTVANMDGLNDTNHARLAWEGIRYMTVGWDAKGSGAAGGGSVAGTPGVGGGGDAIDIVDIEGAMKKGGKYFTNPSNCVLLVTVNQMFTLMTSAAFKTWSQVGPSNTLTTGSLGTIYGFPMIYSDVIDTNLSDLAVKTDYDSTATGLSCAHMWRKDRFLLGMFDTVKMEQTRWAPKLFTISQADVRADFKCIEAQQFNTAAGPWPAITIYDVLP